MPFHGRRFRSLTIAVFQDYQKYSEMKERKSMNKTIAICDQDHEYARHLAMHMLREERGPYEPRIFRSVEELRREQDPESTVLLMIDSQSLQSVPAESGFEKKLILVGDQPPETMKEHALSKYTPMRIAMQRIREELQDADTSLPGQIRMSDHMKVIGVFSPGTSLCKTQFSLTLIQILAEQGRTLYLNFEGFSGLNAMVRPAFDSSLEELMFLLPDQADKISSKLSMITRAVGGADAAPPVRNYESLGEIGSAEWLSLIDAAVKWTDYRFLVLDLCEGLRGLTEILKRCHLIYVLQQEQDLLSESRMEEFERALKERDCQELLLRTRVWKLPPMRGGEGGDLRALSRSSYAGLMREQVKRDAQELRRDTGDRS